MEYGDSIAAAVKAVEEEEELEALVDVLGDEVAQSAAHLHTLPILVTTAQI